MFILKYFLILVSFKETIFVLLLNEWDRKLPVNIYGSAPLPFINIATK